MKPSDCRTSGNSSRRSDTHWGVERKAACIGTVESTGEEDKSILEPIEELLENTFLLLTFTLKSRIGKETGASWKVQEQFHVPKRRGIILEPEQVKVDPSTVSY